MLIAQTKSTPIEVTKRVSAGLGGQMDAMNFLAGAVMTVIGVFILLTMGFDSLKGKAWNAYAIIIVIIGFCSFCLNIWGMGRVHGYDDALMRVARTQTADLTAAEKLQYETALARWSLGDRKPFEDFLKASVKEPIRVLPIELPSDYQDLGGVKALKLNDHTVVVYKVK